MINKLLIPIVAFGAISVYAGEMLDNLLHPPVSHPFYVGASFEGNRVKTSILTAIDGNGNALSNHINMYGATITIGHKFSEALALEVNSGFTTGSGAKDFLSAVKETEVQATITDKGGNKTDCTTKDGKPLKFKLKNGPRGSQKVKLDRIPLFVNLKWQTTVKESLGFYAKVGGGVEFLAGKVTAIAGVANEEIVGNTCDTVTVEDKGTQAKITTTKLKRIVRPAGRAELGIFYNLANNVTASVGIGGTFSQKKSIPGVVRAQNVKADTPDLVRVGGIVPFVQAGLTIAF